MKNRSRKIAVTAIELAAIIAALNDYGMPTFAAELHDRFVAADPANDGPETKILADPYLQFARELQITYPHLSTTAAHTLAKAQLLGEGYGMGE